MGRLLDEDAVINAINALHEKPNAWLDCAVDAVKDLQSAQIERDMPKRVLWSGWKGYRDTRYKCPNCKKPVRNDDVYCHRCGQKLMFPSISFTPYVEG